MIALFGELYPAEPVDVRAAARLSVGMVVTGVAVLPALLGFAEPVRKGAAVMAWLKHIVGVLICGALIALGNWIYTLFSTQWTQAGMPDLPPMVSKPGGAAGSAAPPGGATTGVRIGTPPAQAARPVQSSFLDEYRD